MQAVFPLFFGDNMPKVNRSQFDDRLFYEGDFSQKKERKSVLGMAAKTLAIGAGLLYAYRGLRGAGWYPLTKRFWWPLKKIQRSNVTQSFFRSGLTKKLGYGSDKWKEAVNTEMKSGFGLWSMGEGLANLFARSIRGATDVMSYLGVFPKGVMKKARALPRLILGGYTGKEVGLRQATKGYQARIVGKAVVDGGKRFMPGFKTYFGAKKAMEKRIASGYYEKSRLVHPDLEPTTNAGILRNLRRTPSLGPRKGVTVDQIRKRVLRRYDPFRENVSPSLEKMTMLKTIGRVSTSVIVPTYFAYLGFKYLDYHLRNNKALDKTPLREGVTGAASTMWVRSRMFMQQVLDNVGVLDAHKYLNTLMPGYLKGFGMIAGGAMAFGASSSIVKSASRMGSTFRRGLAPMAGAASKVAFRGLSSKKLPGGKLLKRIASRYNPFGSTSAGFAFGRGFTTTALGAFFGGVIGYAMESGLSRKPDQLERIYSGEEKIPVRKGRWWEFGRTPYEGGKISYYKKHWYPMQMSRYKDKGALYPSEKWKWKNHWHEIVGAHPTLSLFNSFVVSALPFLV